MKNCFGDSSSPRMNAGRNALRFGALVEEAEAVTGRALGWQCTNTQDPD